ncbi:MAG TPA: ribonuclease PH [Candidatus Babeliales bacterium]|jgi:ribonuclease PH|nr:ribonuclease PH [Candidatus Babeliales bacterium]
MIERNANRRNDELRPFLITYDVFSNADASILFELGNTKVLCAVTMQAGVPPFLRGQGIGWLNAEYALLPTATSIRAQRESTSATRTGRSVEISRFIGRSLRTIVNCNLLGERTIYIDCDVLQADGGTRVAALTASCMVLRHVQKKWLAKKIITTPILTDDLVAISVGIKGSDVLLDPDYQEDSTIDADFNFVLTRSGRMIEVHGGAEQIPIEWSLFDKARMYAMQASHILFNVNTVNQTQASISSVSDISIPLFSLKNRLSSKQTV